MIEPKACSYEMFPKSLESPSGMRIINEDKKAWSHALLHDVEYCKRDGVSLHLHILKPRFSHDAENEYLPCIVYIKGSAFHKQNTYINLCDLTILARKGYAVVSVEYRPSEVAPFPAQLVDAKTAVRFIRKYASDYNIDPNRIVLFGDSSGGHTALMAGITNGIEELDTTVYNEFETRVSAIIDYYGPTDFTKMNDVPSTQGHRSPESPEGMLLGKKDVMEHIEEAKKASPITYLSKERDIPPILIFHGNKDRLVPFNQSVILYDALKSMDKKVEFYCLDEADHGGPVFWTDEILTIIDEFIQESFHAEKLKNRL